MPSLHRRSDLVLLASGFFVLCVVYYFWGWSHVLGDLGGDNAYYLLTARHFSPWSTHSDVATYFATHSQYPPLYPLVLAILGGGESLLVAHLITVTCLLLTFVVFYTWLRMLDVPVLVACKIISLQPGGFSRSNAGTRQNYALFTF